MLLADLGSNVAVDVLAGVVLTGLGGFMIWMRSQLKDVGQMTRDWRGVPERPGVSDEIPGVMKRLYTQDQQFKEVMTHLGHQDATLQEIQHEINYNSGSSIKDAVHRTDDAVKALRTDVTEIKKKLSPNPEAN
jgi:hypothetical protein